MKNKLLPVYWLQQLYCLLAAAAVMRNSALLICTPLKARLRL